MAKKIKLDKVSVETWEQIGRWLADRIDEMEIDREAIEEEDGPEFLPALEALSQKLRTDSADFRRMLGGPDHGLPVVYFNGKTMKRMSLGRMPRVFVRVLAIVDCEDRAAVFAKLIPAVTSVIDVNAYPKAEMFKVGDLAETLSWILSLPKHVRRRLVDPINQVMDEVFVTHGQAGASPKDTDPRWVR